MPTLGLHRRVRVCQCAAGDGWQCDSASVGAGVVFIGPADCGGGCGADQLVLSIMAALVVII